MLKGQYIIGVGLLISVLRYYLEHETSSEVVTFIMAIINVVALDYVCLIIVNDVYTVVESRLKGCSLPQNQKKHLLKIARRIVKIIGWVLFLPLSLLYVCRLYDSMWNDILAIIAFVFSISAEDITQYLGEKIYRAI